MTPSRPYLVRAFYDWLLDNDMTPHLLVNAEVPHVQVPLQFVKDGQIVLNIAPQAVMSFAMGKESISFSARFGDCAFQVYPDGGDHRYSCPRKWCGDLFPPRAGL